MLSERSLLDAWTARKGNVPYYRLAAEFVAEFEYRGAQFGHPSTYAAVTILAQPASEFRLDSVVSYPVSVSSEDAEDLFLAVGRGAIDELFASGWYAYRSCGLTVREVGWNDVTSSEVAMYVAARGALKKLRLEGVWTLVT
jgi:hypothetical protein